MSGPLRASCCPTAARAGWGEPQRSGSSSSSSVAAVVVVVVVAILVVLAEY